MACLAGLADGQAAVLASLPPLSTEVLSVLVVRCRDNKYIQRSTSLLFVILMLFQSLLTATDDMRVPSSALKLLGGFANTEDNCKVIFEGPNVRMIIMCTILRCVDTK